MGAAGESKGFVFRKQDILRLGASFAASIDENFSCEEVLRFHSNAAVGLDEDYAVDFVPHLAG